MPDADYVLYVTGTQYHCEAFYIVAFAAACQLEDQYDRYILIITKHIVFTLLVLLALMKCSIECFYCRPIAGIANFCPNQVNKDIDDEEFYAIAKHEVFHALVNYFK